MQYILNQVTMVIMTTVTTIAFLDLHLQYLPLLQLSGVPTNAKSEMI